MGDGLLLVPPTRERVEGMLAGTDRDPEYVAVRIPPNFAPCAEEEIAINAVMAGCLPEYMPVLVTAVEAMGNPASISMATRRRRTHSCKHFSGASATY